MPRYDVKLGRAVTTYETTWCEVEADDEYHARALAIDIANDTPDELNWRTVESYDAGDVEAEECREVKDDQA